MPMGGKQSSRGRRREAGDTTQRLLTKATASMPANGRFPISRLRGVYANNSVYEDVTGWESFEPTLSRVEEMDAGIIWRCAADVPDEWYEGDRQGLEQLVEKLSRRRESSGI